MVTPEDQARQKIDALLEAAGWVIQDRSEQNRNAALGVAIREFPLGRDEADYLLFVGGKAAGVVEAKKAGVTLTGVSEQSEKYMAALPEHLAKWDDSLRFNYESTGEETAFRDTKDPKARSRRVFAFHRPETLLAWLQEEDTLRGRLQDLPQLDEAGLRQCQVEAINGLERSLADDRPRSLIQMATGAGKTFTACSFSWRLLKYAGAKRILFLVDRSNLGRQTLKEFQEFQPPGTGRQFSEIYIPQLLGAAGVDKDAKIVITTIQRIYSMLRGEIIDDETEEQSSYEVWEREDGEIKPIEYNPELPIETFDFIITDECHRSIYGLWRQVLDYFDASIIGLTATPTKHTLGFFQQNIVSEYPYERSVADGVNVGYEVFRIKTEVSEQGGLIEEGYTVAAQDKRTRSKRYQELDKDLDYDASALDKTVLSENQIRTVLQAYKDNLFTELFPGRSGDWVPKTLIFAKDDNHAEEIVTAAREVFGEGNDFAKKITYRVSGEKPENLIKAFRLEPNPRIAVTVDMIATGTDIKPVEVLIFMRDVKSEGYYEQMKGRGVRTIKDADLKSVTPDAQTKTRFVLIDAIGVTEGKKNVSQPLERKRSVSFDKLMEQIAQGRRDDDALASLAARLAALEHNIDREDAERIKQVTGRTLPEIANALLDAIDADKVEAVAKQDALGEPSPQRMKAAEERLKDEACSPFDQPEVRKTLSAIKQKSEIIRDDLTTDRVTHASFDLVEARKKIDSFKAFIEEHKDEITALQILYSQPLGKQRVTYAQLKDLSNRLKDRPHYLTTADVWQAYKRLEEAKVRGAPEDRLLTEIVSLVRFAIGQVDLLEPIARQIDQRFNLWIGRQKKAGETYTEEQMDWLKLIRDHIKASAEITQRDLMESPDFADRGGVIRARAVFGQRLEGLLDELTEALVA